MSLIAHYTFDGVGKELLSGRESTFFNAISVDGETSPAVSLSDTSHAVYFEHDSFLSNRVFGDSDNFSFEARIKIDDFVSWGCIFNKALDGDWSSTTTGLWVENDFLTFVIGTNGRGNPDNSSRRLRVSKSDISSGWNIVIGVVRNNIMEIWINEKNHGFMNIETLSHDRTENNVNIVIGPRTFVNDNSNQASFDVEYIKFYDHALSKKEITQINNKLIFNIPLKSEFVPSDANHPKVLSGYSNFDGTNEIDFDKKNKFVLKDQTIEILIRPKSRTPRQTFYERGHGSEVTINHELSGTLRYYFGPGTGNMSPYAQLNSSVIPLDEWTHATIVRDFSDKTLKWYINGELNTQTDFTYDSAGKSNIPFLIGSGYTNGFIGDIGIIKEYAKAFSAEEVEQLYQNVFSLDSYGNLFLTRLNTNNYIVASEYNRIIDEPFEIIQDVDREIALADTAINTLSNTNIVEYDFYVNKAGTYKISGTILAVDGGSDSFYMSINGSDYDNWVMETSQNYTKRTWRDDVQLTEGVNTLRVRGRETNCKCSVWIIEDQDGNLVTPIKTHLNKNKDFRSSVSEIGLTKNLVAYYPLKYYVNDYSGNNNHGSTRNNPLPIKGGFDGMGAYQFDRDDSSFIVLGNLDEYELLPDKKWSISLWTNAFGEDGYYIAKGTANSSGIQFGIWHGTNALRFVVGGASRASAILPNNNEPNHLVLVCDGTTMRGYVNGELGVSGSVGEITRIGTDVLLGARRNTLPNNGSAYHLTGDISNVKIFNTDLSHDEILTEYKRIGTGKTKMNQFRGINYIQGQYKETI
ncbi:hypothetical protein VmeM32_00160 [Vibrio phage vB_VmeM-32]|nr:hypothetical protein VmeM32_00160 [Vibrio phage vB_VmeM-32]